MQPLCSLLLFALFAACTFPASGSAGSTLTANSRAEDSCDLLELGKSANITLEKFMGRWFEIRYNSSAHPEEDGWLDYSENYALDTKVPFKVNIIYSYRNSSTKLCSVINSIRDFRYVGDGVFQLTKSKQYYAYVTLFVDPDYQYSVVALCPNVLSNGYCNQTFDVKVFSRNNKYFDSKTEAVITKFFKEKLTCIDYDKLRITNHDETQPPCPIVTPGGGAQSTMAFNSCVLLVLSIVITLVGWSL